MLPIPGATKSGVSFARVMRSMIYIALTKTRGKAPKLTDETNLICHNERMEKFILHQKTYDFVLWLYPIVNRLPKNHRHILGKKLEEEGLSLLVNLINANNNRGVERRSFQNLSSNELDLLRILLRLTKDLRLMSVKQYIFGSEKLNEIGRMLSCWMGKTNEGMIKDGKN